MNQEPLSTYRVQLRSGVDFEAVRIRLPYLEKLGITDLYLSPIFPAGKGSTHGYDVVAHDRVDPLLGGDDAFARLSQEARSRNMGVIVDWVPNHMSVESDDNPLWQDVLTFGRASRYGKFFDIEWKPLRAELEGKVLLPILEASYGKVLHAGKLKLEARERSFVLRYGERDLPISPSTVSPIFRAIAEHDGNRSKLLRDAASQLAELKAPWERDARLDDHVRARSIVAEVLPDVDRAALERSLAALNGTPSDNASFDTLDALVSAQAYRPSVWSLSLETINYRRFFDVNHLAALRMEDPEVFDESHRHLLQLIARGLITGIRLDHTDGLADPHRYFEDLQAACRKATGDSMWIVAEKILAPGEPLPRPWTISGTTGYEFARIATGVLTQGANEHRLVDTYRRLTGDRRTFEEHVRIAKRLVLRTTFNSEVRALADQLERIAQDDREYKDLPRAAIRSALEETIVGFGVYRSYVRADSSREPTDPKRLSNAFDTARSNLHGPELEALSLIESLLTPSTALTEARAIFVVRLQQLTGPVTAKSVEDTTFYRYMPLLSGNEVGSEPSHLSVPLEEFHRENSARATQWPRSMISTSTHDTKRGEDARARLASLSEIPTQWKEAVSAFMRRARNHRTTLGEGRIAPSARDEYMLYQSILGAWPLGGAPSSDLGPRIHAFAEKAMRESKEETSWIRPDQGYENAMHAYIDALLNDGSFMRSMTEFAASLDQATTTRALAQLVLRLASPGVADTYQGSEVWNTSLVDPDNRRSVPSEDLERQLTALIERGPSEVLCRELYENAADGRVKLWVTHRALITRRDAREVFEKGTYRALRAGAGIIAFERASEGRAHVIAVRRWNVSGKAREALIDRELFSGKRTFHDVFTGTEHRPDKSVEADVLFRSLPVAWWVEG